MERFRHGFAGYLGMTRYFSANAWLVLINAIGNGLAFGVFLFTFNFYVLSLGPGYNEGFLGTLQSAASLATIVMALPAAYLAGRYSQKWLMVAGGLLSLTAYLGIVLFPSQGPLIFFRMVAGAGMSLSGVAAAPFLMANTHELERQWVFSFQAGLSTAAGFFGNLLAGLLPGWLGALAGVEATSTFAYRLSLGSMALVGLLATLPLLAIRPVATAVSGQAPLPWTQMRRHSRLFVYFLLPSLIIGLGAGLMQPFMNVYFRNVYRMPDPTIAIVFAIGGLAMAVGQFAGPPMAEKYGKIKTVMLTQALSIPFLMTLGLGAWAVTAGHGSVMVFFILAGIAYVFRLALMNLSNPVYQTYILERVPREAQALMISLTNLTFQVGWFIMPQVSGQWQVRYGPAGFTRVFASVTLLYAAAIGIEYYLFVRKAAIPAAIPAVAEE